jgi:succinoglycan biosynthesis protein ExoV
MGFGGARMKLFWSKSARGNVGDDLNPLLWNKLLGEAFFDGDDGEVFIGVGSVLSGMFAHGDPRAKKIVFGAGARSSWSLPDIDDSWTFAFVRGPRTAHLLASYDVSWIADPAILTPIVLPAPLKDGRAVATRTAFIPHHQTPEVYTRWICEALDLVHVSPHLPPDVFVRRLTSCDRAVCEAMHGAILSDAYRIPWLGMRFFNEIHEGFTTRFKWSDWLGSMNLDRTPVVDASVPLARFARKGLDRHARAALLFDKVVPIYGDMAAKRIETAMSSDFWTLSELAVFEERCAAILDQVDALKARRRGQLHA